MNGVVINANGRIYNRSETKRNLYCWLKLVGQIWEPIYAETKELPPQSEGTYIRAEWLDPQVKK